MAAKQQARPVGLGDIYAGRLLDGRYGAVQVIKVYKGGPRRRDSFVLACTEYIGAEPPAMNDPALRKVLRQKFGFRNHHALLICDRPPPDDFVYIGTRPPTKKTAALDACGTSGTFWSVHSAVLIEWRWVHDREAMEREHAAACAEAEREHAIAKTHPPPRPRKRTPRSTLTERDFWALLETLGANAADAAVDVAPLVAALARRSQADIREFHELLAHKLWVIDSKRHAAAAGAAGKSDDAFLYARCHVVARGKRFYQDVIHYPERFPPDVDLEELLTVAPAAWRKRTGDDLEEDTHYSWETGSNAIRWA